MSTKFVMFSGKQLGAECLQVCLAQNFLPQLVVTNPEDKGKDTSTDLSVLKLCNENGIPAIDFKEFLKNPKELEHHLKDIQVGFSTFCSRIIPPPVIKQFPKGITNLHFSLLPKYRGQFPTVYAIFNGDSETGVTLHLIDEGTDSGDILVQRKIEISPTITGFELFEECKELGVKLFKEQLEFLKQNNWPTPVPQKDVSSHPIQPKVLPNNGEIDWNWSGERIFNFFRACYHPSFPLPYFSIGVREFEIKEK